jgi:hypothetical protein
MTEGSPEHHRNPELDSGPMTDETATEIARFAYFLDPDSQAAKELAALQIDVYESSFSTPTVKIRESESRVFTAVLDVDSRQYYLIETAKVTPRRGTRLPLPVRKKTVRKQRPMTEADGQALLELLVTNVTLDPRPQAS